MVAVLWVGNTTLIPMDAIACFWAHLALHKKDLDAGTMQKINCTRSLHATFIGLFSTTRERASCALFPNTGNGTKNPPSLMMEESLQRCLPTRYDLVYGVVVYPENPAK